MNELRKKIVDFRSLRNWQNFDSAENLSKSIVIEAAELLEHFQWDNNFNKKEVCDELADVLIYSLSLCYYLDVDPKEIIEEKLKDVAKRYPVNK